MPSKIRVLHLANVVNKNDFVDSLVSNFDRERFDVRVATFTRESIIAAPDYEKAGITQYVLDVQGRKDYVKAVRSLLRIIREDKIDILHTHMFDEAFLGGIIKTLHPRIHFILGRHYSDEIYLTARGFQRRRSLWVEGFANRKADRIIAVSTFIRDLLVKQGVPEAKLFRATYGFDFSQAKYNEPPAEQLEAIRKELGLEGKFVFVNVGRHYFLKRQDLLIRAFGTLAANRDDLRLVLVGDGPWNGHLKDLVKELGLENKVLFPGWRRDVPAILRLSNVVVQPTMTEAFPQIMVEAMAQAKPLVISKVSGPDDQVMHKKTGYLIGPGNLDDLTEALRFMESHRSEHETMGKEARNYVRQQLDINKVIRNYENLYIETLAASRKKTI